MRSPKPAPTAKSPRARPRFLINQLAIFVMGVIVRQRLVPRAITI